MKYHIAVHSTGWSARSVMNMLLEEQIIVQDFGDGQRLVVEVRRASAHDQTPIVHEARLEQLARESSAPAPWQLLRRVRRRDLVLVNAG